MFPIAFSAVAVWLGTLVVVLSLCRIASQADRARDTILSPLAAAACRDVRARAYSVPAASSVARRELVCDRHPRHTARFGRREPA